MKLFCKRYFFNANATEPVITQTKTEQVKTRNDPIIIVTISTIETGIDDIKNDIYYIKKK